MGLSSRGGDHPLAHVGRTPNGGGRIEREFAIGTSRADLVVDFGGQKDVIELKLASAPKALQRGLDQVAAYAKRLSRPVGTLVLFDTQAATPWENRGKLETLEHQGVHVTVLRA